MGVCSHPQSRSNQQKTKSSTLNNSKSVDRRSRNIHEILLPPKNCQLFQLKLSNLFEVMQSILAVNLGELVNLGSFPVCFHSIYLQVFEWSSFSDVIQCLPFMLSYSFNLILEKLFVLNWVQLSQVGFIHSHFSSKQKLYISIEFPV